MMAGQAENKNSTLPLPKSTFHEIEKNKPADEATLGNAILIRSAIDRTIGVCEWRLYVKFDLMPTRHVMDVTSPCVKRAGCQ